MEQKLTPRLWEIINQQMRAFVGMTAFEKLCRVVPDESESWTTHYALFARAGFTEATQSLAAEYGVRLIDLNELGRGLEERG